ncbi:caffeine-induced death protein 2-domain-containing protein [Vararia minispora EC-137]|uniref:Caffeine-induced death protein 2-domain-containing protein n=1 Tax=Vararia minispora EC-137 TaxID=1314806 RepID=A0ACB8QYH7_9AGAM|nr:caffeine-induced death protein 2-domain-containing protein [Vararia minispora EC-137]
MPPKSLVLGSLAIQAPPPTGHTVHVDASVCHNISLFKELLNEYRRLDDAIPMRLNRTTAQFRDRDRLGTGSKGSVQDQACTHLWKELVENWRKRTEIVTYCVNVLDRSLEERRAALGQSQGDPATQRRIQGELFSEETKKNHIHNELVVDTIVRKRTRAVFSARCRGFQPPSSDAEARKWWDAASARP